MKRVRTMRTMRTIGAALLLACALGAAGGAAAQSAEAKPAKAGARDGGGDRPERGRPRRDPRAESAARRGRNGWCCRRLDRPAPWARSTRARRQARNGCARSRPGPRPNTGAGSVTAARSARGRRAACARRRAATLSAERGASCAPRSSQRARRATTQPVGRAWRRVAASVGGIDAEVTPALGLLTWSRAAHGYCAECAREERACPRAAHSCSCSRA